MSPTHNTDPTLDDKHPDYRSAYDYGYNARAKAGKGQREWQDFERELEEGWQAIGKPTPLSWNRAKSAVRDGWFRSESVLNGDKDPRRILH